MISKNLFFILPAVIFVSACQTPTTTTNGWPSSDQSLSAANLVEIEQNLRKLGLFGGRIDGQITEVTRTAIAKYQRSIGAPTNGIISAKLLQTLRSSVATVRTTKPAVKTTPKRKSNTPRIKKTYPAAVAPVTPTIKGGQGDGGGGGGDDGGSGDGGGGGDDGGSGDGGGGGGGDDGGSWG